MYACISRVSQLSVQCPTYMKAIMLKAYVLPVLLYACEVTPYTKTKLIRLNAIVITYARWATGLPKRAKLNAVLCEAGLRPLHYGIDSARANYHALLRCRKKDHVTSLAIKHIQDTRGSSQICTWFRSSMNVFSTYIKL